MEVPRGSGGFGGTKGQNTTDTVPRAHPATPGSVLVGRARWALPCPRLEVASFCVLILGVKTIWFSF